jgi:hypothetical protein
MDPRLPSTVAIHPLFFRRTQARLDERFKNGYETASRQAAGTGAKQGSVLSA